MRSLPAGRATMLSLDPSCSGTWHPLEPCASASYRTKESNSLARSTRASAVSTQEPLPSWGKPSDQASTSPRPWPTPETSSDDVPGASSSPSNSTSRLRPYGLYHPPGHSLVGDSTRWDPYRRPSADTATYSWQSTNSRNVSKSSQ